MYVAKPAKKNGGIAGAARSWATEPPRRDLTVGAEHAGSRNNGARAPERIVGGKCGRSGIFLL